MRVLYAIFFAVAAVARVLDTRQATGQCTSNEFATPAVCGVAGKVPICESKWGNSYVPIISLQVWGASNFVTGIQATYTDGSTSQVYGKTSGVTQTITVDYRQGDLFSQLTMYAYGQNQYVRHLRIRSKKGHALDVGEPLSDPYVTAQGHQDVGSGVLYGFQGSTDGTRIQSLAFLFLESPITEIAVTNFTFPQGPSGSENISPQTLDEAHFYNNQTSGGYQWQFNNQVMHQVSYAFAQSTTDTFAVGETVEVSISGNLGVVTIGGHSDTSFTWTQAYMQQATTTYTTSHQVQWNSQGNLNPGEGVDCVAIAGEGSGTFPYTSTVTITLKNGHQYSFPENGKLKIDSISNAKVEVSTANYP